MGRRIWECPSKMLKDFLNNTARLSDNIYINNHIASNSTATGLTVFLFDEVVLCPDIASVTHPQEY